MLMCLRLIGHLLLVIYSVSSFSETLQLWQVGKQPPLLYEAPTLKSQSKATLKTGQPLVALASQKKWVKCADLNNGAVGWVPRHQISPLVKIDLSFKEAPNSYHYRIKMLGPHGNQQHVWKMAQPSLAQPFPKEMKKVFNTQDKFFREFENLFYPFDTLIDKN